MFCAVQSERGKRSEGSDIIFYESSRKELMGVNIGASPCIISSSLLSFLHGGLAPTAPKLPFKLKMCRLTISPGLFNAGRFKMTCFAFSSVQRPSALQSLQGVTPPHHSINKQIFRRVSRIAQQAATARHNAAA